MSSLQNPVYNSHHDTEDLKNFGQFEDNEEKRTDTSSKNHPKVLTVNLRVRPPLKNSGYQNYTEQCGHRDEWNLL